MVGTGQFGDVWLAEQVIKNKATGENEVKQRAVKMLKAGKTVEDREEFVHESEVTCTFALLGRLRTHADCDRARRALVITYLRHGPIRDQPFW